VTLDHIRIALFDETGEFLERASFRFLDVFWIDNKQVFPAGIIRERDAHKVIVGVIRK